MNWPLADPAQKQVPVLTIAMDAGFQSIGLFNRAFKAATGCSRFFIAVANAAALRTMRPR